MEIEKTIQDLRKHGVHDDDIALYLVTAAYGIFYADDPNEMRSSEFIKMAKSVLDN